LLSEKLVLENVWSNQTFSRRGCKISLA